MEKVLNSGTSLLVGQNMYMHMYFVNDSADNFCKLQSTKIKQKGDRMGRFDLRELHVFINKKIFIAKTKHY